MTISKLMRGSAVSVLLLIAACSGEKPSDTSVSEGATVTDAAAGARAEIAVNPDRTAYFGDLHIHTRNSFDAYIFNVRVTPEDAYRFARGATLQHPGGYDIKLDGPPLDFLAVTDHASYLGILPAMDDPDSELSQLPMARDMFSMDPDKIQAAFQSVGATIRSGVAIEEMNDPDVQASVWAATVAAAEEYNQPGMFTTFAAYEYTSVTGQTPGEPGFGGGNLHRNVFFEGAAPARLFSTLDSTNPEDLWDWMDGLRDEGIESLAIPHNSNVSDGQMFRLQTYTGEELTAAYAEQRMRNEPLVEITQVKGTSETHPALSPNDEWANFEIYEYLLGAHVRGRTEGSYMREALMNGLKLADERGFNPFHFGFIASSDTHVAGGAFSEKDYWSKIGLVDAFPVQRGSVPPGGSKTWEGVERNENAANWFSKWSASGLTGLWAESNTRGSIYAALRRKETFATTGPRIRVRFFASFDFEEDLISSPDLVSTAYTTGVPMGSDLIGDGRAPVFIAWAMRDPMSAPLQRLQIVKGWVDRDGEAREEVIDVACSDGLEPDPVTNRCPDNGASVDLSDCSLSTNEGAPELKTMWRDPDYDPEQRAFYYVRALENPSCRWSTWDALKADVEPNPDLPPTLQERAWSSPIWLMPTPG